MNRMTIHDYYGGFNWNERLTDLLESERKLFSIWIENTHESSRTALEKFLSVKGESVRHLKLSISGQCRNNIETCSQCWDASTRIWSEHIRKSHIWQTKKSEIEIHRRRFITKNRSTEPHKAWNLSPPRRCQSKWSFGFSDEVSETTKPHSRQGLNVIEMPENLKLPFKLKELTFKRCACCYEAHEHNFLKIFELQEKSLEKIVFHQPNMPSVYQQILTRFENLESLHLDGSRLPQSVSFYSGLRKIKRMRHLILDNGFRKHEVAKSFHRLFPNLENLKLSSQIRGWTKNFLKTIMKLHTNLESLSFMMVFKPATLWFKILSHLNLKKFIHRD